MDKWTEMFVVSDSASGSVGNEAELPIPFFKLYGKSPQMVDLISGPVFFVPPPLHITLPVE